MGNIDESLVPDLIRAVKEGKWIMFRGKLVPPLHFINHQANLVEGSLIICDPEQEVHDVEIRHLTKEQRQRVEAFKSKVAEYKAMNIDDLLMEALETNIWPSGLDRYY